MTGDQQVEAAPSAAGTPPQAEPDAGPNLEPARRLAARLVSASLFDEALPLYRMLREAPRASLPDHLGEITCLLGQGEGAAALVRADECLGVFPWSKAAAIALARSLHAAGQLRDSVEVYRAIIERCDSVEESKALALARGGLILAERALEIAGPDEVEDEPGPADSDDESIEIMSLPAGIADREDVSADELAPAMAS
jgi:hypothetical protein